MNTTLVPLNEVIGAIAGDMASAEEIAVFAKDPKGVLASKLMIDTEGTTFNVVENSSDTIHLALPYYSKIEDMQAEVLADESIENVAGGEIIFSTVIGGIVGGIILTTVVSVGAVAATVGGAAIITGAVVGTRVEEKKRNGEK